MPKSIADMGASVRGRLLNLSRATDRPFDLLLTRYALERSSRKAACRYRSQEDPVGGDLTTTRRKARTSCMFGVG